MYLFVGLPIGLDKAGVPDSKMIRLHDLAISIAVEVRCATSDLM